jgi:hypothetical protein
MFLSKITPIFLAISEGVIISYPQFRENTGDGR